MIVLHPNILSKNGKKEFVDKYEDLIELQKAKAEEYHSPTKNISEVKKILHIE